MDTQIIQRWEQTGLLRKTPEDKKLTVSVALENQWQLNTKNNVSGAFARFSIPIVLRVMNAMPCLESKFSEDSNLEKTKITFDSSPISDWNSRMRLDIEAEQAAFISDFLKEEIDSCMKKNNKESINFLGIFLSGEYICFRWI